MRVSGSVTGATLKLTATSAGFRYDVHGGVTNNTWGETSINYSNAPTFSAAALAALSSSFATGTVTSVDVTSAISGNALVTFVIDTPSTTAMSFSSRREAAPPQLVVTTSGGGGDTQAPTIPAGLAAQPVGSSEIDLSWTASTDNVGVKGYHVYRDGALRLRSRRSPLQRRRYPDTGLTAGSTHSYTVDAFDVAGNTSARSGSVSATTANPTDAQPPTTPAAVNAVAASATQVDISWSAATDNVGVTGYTVYRGVNGATPTLLTTTNAASASYSDCTASPSTNYVYCVDAFDAAGNHSTSSCAGKVHNSGRQRRRNHTHVHAGRRYIRPRKRLRVQLLHVAQAAGRYFAGRQELPALQPFRPRRQDGHECRVQGVRELDALGGYDVRGVSDTTWSETSTTYPGPAVDATVAAARAPRSSAAIATSTSIHSLQGRAAVARPRGPLVDRARPRQPRIHCPHAAAGHNGFIACRRDQGV